MRGALVGPSGVRAGWRLLAFLVVVNVPLGLLQWVVIKVFHVEHVDFAAGPLILGEAVSLAFAAAGTLVMARWERRRLERYGVGLVPEGIALLGEGTLWGALSNLAVIALIALCGGYSVTGLDVHGVALVTTTLLWVAAFLAIALAEEVYFRGYPLYTLSTGIGFWPAAALLSLGFGALHFFGKPGETWVDGTTVSLIALFFCLTIRRTGSVWWAVGWHFSWNWMSMGIFGSPNTGNQGRPLPGHLLASSFHGSTWLTGGPMGAEASLWMFPLLAALFGLFHLRHRVARFPAEDGR